MSSPAEPAPSRARQVREYEDGKSPAAWTGVIIAAVGFIVATVGAMAGPNWTVIIVGAAVVIVALIVTGIMKAAGLGQSH